MSEQQALTRTDRNPSAQGDGAADRATLAPQAAPEQGPRQNLNSALIPQNFEQLERFSKAVASSQMVPKAFQRRPQDVMVAVMHGLEIGLKPLQSLQNIAVINGKPSIYGDAAIALVRQSTVCKYVREWIDGQGDSRTAFCESHRKGEPEPQVRSFSVDDAKQANLWGKRGPWQDYPQRMLQMRARSWLLRDVYADVLAGLYIAEEAMDIPSDEEATGPDYPKMVRQAKGWLAAKPDDALEEAFQQVRAKAADWPEEYRARVEDVIAKRKEACSQLPDDTPAEDANEETAEEHPDYNARIDRLRAELRAAYGDENAWNSVIEKWIGITAEWPKQQKQRANRAVVDTKEQCEKAAEEAKAEQATRAAEAMKNGETALPKKEKQSAEPAPLPEDVPMRQALIDAGLTTRADVQRLYAEGELQDVKGIGPKSESQIVKTLGLDDDVSIPTDDGTDLFQ